MRRLGVIGIVLLGSCTPSTLVGEKANGAVEGIAYHLPIDIVEVTVTETTAKRKAIGVTREEQRVVEYDVTDTDRSYALATKTVADTSARYRLKLNPGSASADEVTILTRPNGLLESINATSTGKAGTVIKNVASIVGTVVGAVAGLPKALTAGDVSDDPALLEAAVQKLLLETKTDLLSKHPNAPGLDINSERLARSLSGQPRALLFVLSQWEIHRVNWIVSLALTDRIEALSIRRAEMLAKGEDAKTITTAITTLAGERAARLAAIGTQAAPIATRLVPAVEKKTYKKTIRIGALPRTVDFAGENESLSPEAEALRDATGLVISRSDLPAAVTGGESGSPEAARIYYRQPVLVTLTTWQVKDDDTKRLDDSIVEVICSASPVHHLKFETNAFAKRSLIVKFDGQGRLQSVKRVTESSAAASTAAVADGLTALQESVKTSIEKSGAIIAAKDKIELDRLQHDLSMLQKEKEVVDAQVELAGSEATQELRVQQATLAAQLAQLQAEVSLAKAQATREADIETVSLNARLAELNARLALEKAEQAAQSAVKIDQLTQEVMLLRKQIELLAEQKQLEEANK